MKLQKTDAIRNIVSAGVTLLTLAVLLVDSPASAATSQQLQQQIDNLNNQQSANQQNVTHLRSQAGSYQDEISKLQSQITQIEQQIAGSQARQAELQGQIVKTQAELEQQRQLLSSVLKSLYMDGDVSTMEMLATSNNLSDYVDKQEYRLSVQGKISGMMLRVKKLEAELKTQKAEVDQLLASQKAQQAELDSKRAEQEQMLAYNQEQQATYNSQLSANNAKLSSLYSQLATLNSSGNRNVSYAGSGGYPAKWANAPQDTIIDDWGMFNRECVSYTAWKVAASGRRVPYWGGIGNAYQWIQNARGAGIPVDGNPRVGDVAIRDRNYSLPNDVGHSMYVEAVYQSGGQTWVRVSQYNAGYDGRYSEADKPAAGLYFIHF